jgi:hypothetical protein
MSPLEVEGGAVRRNPASGGAIGRGRGLRGGGAHLGSVLAGVGSVRPPVRSLGDDGWHRSLEPLLLRGKWRGWDTRSTGSSSSARARARGVTWLCECTGGTARRRRRARRGSNGVHERGARRVAAFVAGAAPCLRVEVRAGVNTSVRRPASVGALTQGRDQWPDW